MPTSRPPADYRQRLIHALAVVIARDGFHGAKIQDVVKVAHVSLRTFYAEFPNKEACYLALYEQQTDALLELIGTELDFERPWRDVMRSSFERYFGALAAVPLLTHAGLIELGTLSEEGREARQVAFDRFVVRVADLVEQGRIANPHIPSRALSPLMGRAIMGGVTELVVNNVIRGETERLPELVDTATDMLVSVVMNVHGVNAPWGPDQIDGPKSGETDSKASSGADVRR